MPTHQTRYSGQLYSQNGKYYHFKIYDKNYLEVVLFFTTQPSKFLFSFLVIFAFFYSALNISEIFEDYLHNEKIKNVANKILFLSAIVIPILTIIMLLFLKV